MLESDVVHCCYGLMFEEMVRNGRAKSVIKRGVFKTQWKIYDGAFWQKWLKVVNYFRKKAPS